VAWKSDLRLFIQRLVLSGNC